MAKWMQGAVPPSHKGRLTAKAKAAGMTISEYCAQKNLSTQTKRECVLAKTFKKYAGKGGKK
jgi:hypothetical protein